MRYVKCACPTNLHFTCRSASSLKVACLFQVMLNLHFACYAHGTYSKRIRHTPGTHRTSRKFLSMFDFFFFFFLGGGGGGGKRALSAQRLTATYIDVQQAYTKRKKNARLTRF